MRLLFLLVAVGLCAWAGFVNAGWVDFGNAGLLFPCGVAAGFIGLIPERQALSYRDYYRS
jgi:hypothetical protein